MKKKKKKQDDTALHKQKLKISCRLEHLFQCPHTNHKKKTAFKEQLAHFCHHFARPLQGSLFCVCVNYQIQSQHHI